MQFEKTTHALLTLQQADFFGRSSLETMNDMQIQRLVRTADFVYTAEPTFNLGRLNGERGLPF